MNDRGLTLFTAMDGVDDQMLLDALPPGADAYTQKSKKHRFSAFFERPWVAAVISATVALAVLSGIIWAGQQPASKPSDPIGANPGQSDFTEETFPHEEDIYPDYDNPPVADDAKVIIASGGYRISPFEYIQWQQIWNSDTKTFDETRDPEQWFAYLEEADSGSDITDRAGIFYSLPRIPYDSSFSVFLTSTNLRFMSVSAYNESFRHVNSAALDTGMTLNGFMDILTTGSYYILLTAYEAGDYIEEAGQKEGTMYEFLFAVDILYESITELPDVRPVDPEFTDAVFGTEVWVGTNNSTYTMLMPHVLSASFYNDDYAEWEQSQGDSYTKWGYMPRELPELVYNSNFRLFTRTWETPNSNSEYVIEFSAYTILTKDFVQVEVTQDVTEDLYLLSTLTPGTYYVILETWQTGRKIDGGYEKGVFEYAFQITVTGEQDAPYQDVFVLSGDREVRPEGKNQWTKEALQESLQALPAAHSTDCSIVVPNADYSMYYLVVYQIENLSLTKVQSISATDLDALKSLPDGYYCVVFSAQCTDKAQEGETRSRDYAFTLYAGYTWETAVPSEEGTDLP